MERVKGSNKHGNKNEDNIVAAINGISGEGSKYKDLNLNLKTFISEICSDKKIKIDDNTIVKAEKEKNNRIKPDFYIFINDEIISISCKMGRSNSVHQEKIEGFCLFIKSQLMATEDICDDFRFYIWADGTVDGTGDKKRDVKGNIISRITGREFKKLYPDRRKRLLTFIKDNQRELLKRFIFTGIHNQNVDYVYHGTEENAVWLSQEEVLDYNIKNSKLDSENPIAVLPCGRATLQAWNISQNGENEHKRGEIQAKYGDMKKDFLYLMNSKAANKGTFFGDQEEYDLSRKLNQKKDSSMWKTLLNGETDFSDKFLVKVSTKQTSKLNGKRVNVKADAYVIKGDISQQYLLEKNYVITEDDLINIKYETISRTGISIKRENSKNFTFQKFGINSFISSFTSYLDNPKYFFTGILMYVSEKDLDKNREIINNLGVNIEDFMCFFNSKGLGIKDIENVESYIKIKEFCQNTIKRIIEKEKYISDLVFKGSNNFEEPYVAHYIYANGRLEKNEFRPFYITTGSGRSSGKYTIVIKPI